jgi:hypothetical protein
MLGEQEINSLDDDLDRARQMKIHYETARDSTLEAHEWSFAIVRFKPAALSREPVWGPTKAFQVPNNVLRVLSCHRDESFSVSFEKEQIQWVLEQDGILCDEEVIYCRGIQRVTEEGRFSSLFDSALAAKLAALTALNLTASAEIQGNMLQFYAGFIAEAKSRDGLQGRSRRIRQRTLQKVR